MGIRKDIRARLLRIGGIVAAAVCCLLLALFFISRLSPGESGKPIVFADPALSADIFSDEEYLELDRDVYLESGDDVARIRTAIDEESYLRQPAEVRMLIAWITAARDGDAAGYNACLSPEYRQKSGAKALFTQQKLYDITIREHTIDVAVPEGYASVSCYGVAYKIKDNNGSLRDDMGSDAELEQYVYVVKDRDGQAAIYGIRTFLARK